MTPALRLVRDDDPLDDVCAGATYSASASGGTDRFVDSLQTEIDGLKEEVHVLRRRDEAINFYMHRLDEELRLAARLQQDFLPKSMPQVGPIRFHTLYRPCGYVSGDLYDVFRLDETHVGFYLADAVGHGMPAALLTMFIKTALVTKEITPAGYRLLSPGEAMGRLNEALVSQNLSQATFATAFYGMIDVTTLDLTFARAGHPCPILVRGGPHGAVEALDSGGGLLGIFAGDTYADGSVRLFPGDRLFVYTDGIEVAFAEDQITDSQQWRKELERRRDVGTEQMLGEFSDNLDRQGGSLQPKDDVTMVVVEVN